MILSTGLKEKLLTWVLEEVLGWLDDKGNY